jgi:[acyl-carrier-protein] S-malonyltransferase
MQPAAEAMTAALSQVEITAPAVPLVANVRASAVTEPAQIRQLLIEQVTGSVRWRESVLYMSGEGVREIWEIGAGKALSGMIRRVDREIACRAVGTAGDVAAAAASLADG